MIRWQSNIRPWGMDAATMKWHEEMKHIFRASLVKSWVVRHIFLINFLIKFDFFILVQAGLIATKIVQKLLKIHIEAVYEEFPLWPARLWNESKASLMSHLLNHLHIQISSNFIFYKRTMKDKMPQTRALSQGLQGERLSHADFKAHENEQEFKCDECPKWFFSLHDVQWVIRWMQKYRIISE